MHKQIEGFRLSTQQTSLWLSQREDHNYLAQCAIRLDGPLRSEILRQAFQKIVARHDILRTTFHRTPGIKFPIQVIAKPSTLLLLNTDISDLEPEAQTARVEGLLQQERVHPFNFERGPLIRSQLLTLAPDKYRLLVSVAALCADSWSLKNLVREITGAYDHLINKRAAVSDGANENDATTQYVQFSEWQNQLLDAVDADKGRQYWKRLSPANERDVHLPCEVKIEGPFGAQYSALKLTVRPDVAALITEAARKYGVTAEIVLLGVWLTLLWQLTGKSQLVVRNLFDGRKYEELHDALGAFAHFLPVPCQFEETLSFEAILRNLSATVREATGWQEYFVEGERVESDSLNGNRHIGFVYEDLPSPAYGGEVLFAVDELDVSLMQLLLKLSCVADRDSLRTDFHYDP